MRGITFDFSEAIKAHAIVVSRTGLAVQRRADEAGVYAKKYVYDSPGFVPRTGNLQKKTGHKVVVQRKGKALILRNPAKYARAIDQGSPPHIIRARNAKALRFMVGGRWVFRKSVMHPGNRPFRFLKAAVPVAGRVWSEGIGADMVTIASRFGR